MPIPQTVIFRLGVLITIEALLTVITFGITTNLQSQSITTGNTIDIAGKNRYLTSNLLLQIERVSDGRAQIVQLRNASDALNLNILLLKSGGMSPDGIYVAPLSDKYVAEWNGINQKRNLLDANLQTLSEAHDNQANAITITSKNAEN